MAYKVVTIDKQSAQIKTKDFIVQYKVGEFVTAPIGGLLVFRKVEDAKQFATQYNRRVYKVTCKGRIPLPFSRCYLNDSPECFKQIWGKKTSGKLSWPTGTQAFKQVKLLARFY